MQSSRLVEAVSLLKSEYERFDLGSLIAEAVNLAAQRPNLNPGQYQSKAAIIRDRAIQALDNNILNNAPADIINPIKDGRLSALLPSRIAKMILASIPASNSQDGAASPEISLYYNQANQVMSEIDGFLSTAFAFGVEHYEPKSDSIGIEIYIPRMLFDNELEQLGEKISSFDKLMRPLSELFTGSRVPPKLLYITTSNPIFIVEWLPAAAVPFFIYYREILDIASSALNVMKLLRDLKNSGANNDAVDIVEGQISGIVESKTRTSVEAIVKQYEASLPPGRANELMTEIEIHTKVIVKDVARGARVSININTDIDGMHDRNIQSNIADNPSMGINRVAEIAKESASLGEKLQSLFESMADYREKIENKTGAETIDV